MFNVLVASISSLARPRGATYNAEGPAIVTHRNTITTTVTPHNTHIMTRDSTATYLHMHHSHHADLLEQFTNLTSSQLAPEDIYVPPHLQPVNPEDEDDVVPDQHAAFGIQRATQTKKEPTWRDLGLGELLRRGPGESGGGAARGGVAVSAGGVAHVRNEEPVRLALSRQPGARGPGVRVANGGGEMHSAGGGAGNGLPR
ncbi:Apc13p-domain-containing protein [Clathrospora elynae]|uniref:Apc13p-domain-containing protein n=1 Tax=Clathrospora elynae TaxID=706981 RepID=A0A6A5SWR2_9PLEO|nr:Apc13p-domain-containing protein [Clathrospora elynae]